MEALANAPEGLDLRLRRGSFAAPDAERAHVAPGVPIAGEDVDRLLARLPPVDASSDPTEVAVLRPASEPPPRTGDVVRTTFPPPPGPPPPKQAPGPLEVLRRMPEGEVRLARELTVVFNQPMIALTSQDQAATTPPVKLSPQPAGRWRWVDPRTLQFRPDGRFPQATKYTVEIPAGTKSVEGTPLHEAVSFTFETPSLRLEASYPSGFGTRPTSVPIVHLFDQAVDPALLMANVTVTANEEVLSMRVLTEAELAEAAKSDRELARFLEGPNKAGHRSRLLALRPARDFPKEASITTRISPGARSAEGPGLTQGWITSGFRTLAPLRFLQDGCSGVCAPEDSYSINFNNVLDPEKFDPTMVEVVSGPPDLQVLLDRGNIDLRGSVRPRTVYNVKISSRLTDEHGQTLGEDVIRHWRVGEASARFDGPYGMTVLEPRDGKPVMEVFSRGYERFRVKLYRVEPKDYPAFDASRYRFDREETEPPGAKVFDGTLPAVDAGDDIATTPIDLSAAMFASGVGHAIALVEPEPRAEAYPVTAWLQSTRLGLDAFLDQEGVVVLVTELATGEPAPGVEVLVEPGGAKGRTDEEGLLTLALPFARSKVTTVVARRGDDAAILTTPSYGWNYGDEPMDRSLSWYVIDDRGTYRPGEEVTLKGWIRRVNLGKRGDVEEVPGIERVDYVVFDTLRVRIAEGSAPVGDGGGFDTRFRLPATPNLGAASVELRAKGPGGVLGSDHIHKVDVREFRRPEYEVQASASDGPHSIGGSADVTVRAGYFAGGPLPQAPVRWTISSRRAAFVPPGHDDYAFGVVPSWWFDYDGGDYGSTEKTLQASGATDALGAHTIRLDLPTAKPAIPMSVEAVAEVEDVNRQAWTGKTKLLVHPADLYVGVKTNERFVEQGATATVSVLAVDHAGVVVSGAGIDVTVNRREWGGGKLETLDSQHCFVVSGDRPSTCDFRASEGGSYEVLATILDSKGRPSQTESSFWVSRREAEPSLRVEQEEIELLADAEKYAPGETARLSVGLPFYPAEAVVTVRRSGILETRRLTITKATTIEVAIEDGMVPNVFVQVDAVGRVARDAVKAGSDQGAVSPMPPRPAYASGVLELSVPPTGRTLDVRVQPRHPSLAPAAETGLAVEVRDAAGKPVQGAEVAVFVVDEAVLALSDHRLPDPMGVFYPKRGAGTEDLHSREYVALKSGDGVGGAYGESEQAEEMPLAQPPLFLREDFNPLAAFFPALVTDAAGLVTADFKLPDSVTRYRIFAVAASGSSRFGKGEGTITARLPLTARPSAPRFLNFGDVFELPVVVQNQTDAETTVRVALRTQNLRLTAGAGREVRIPANDRVEVRFPAAADLAGKASFQVVAVSDSASDAAAVTLPVWTPATTEAFATYGVIDDGAIHQKIEVPKDVWPTFGGLDVTTASTNLQALTDAFLYLVAYPHECGEQLSSRMLGILALQDVLTAFKAPGVPTATQLRNRLETDIAELVKKQQGNGGFVVWTRRDPADAFVSVHATHALVRARSQGITVPPGVLENALRFLEDIENHYTVRYSRLARVATLSYALATRAMLGSVDVAEVRRLIEQAGGVGELPIEAAAWLLAALAGENVPEKEALVRHLLNRVSETAGSASFVADVFDEERVLLSSDRRADAIVLDSLILARPDLDLIPRVVTGLLAHRSAGRWRNTQENVFALLALNRYFRTYEKLEPDFLARLWLGDDYAGEHAFRGRSTESHSVRIPTREVAARDGRSLVIAKEGSGRLYYRAGLSYAPRSSVVAAADRGFVVERAYEGADDPTDVVRNDDGSWNIRLGSRVRVRLHLLNEARRYQVALVDPLPAGLEPLGPESRFGVALDDEYDDWRHWWRTEWFDHQNVRDERIEAFASLLWPGDHVYEYLTRATTPGTFVVPPTKAEEMYMPETFGRTASTRVVVE